MTPTGELGPAFTTLQELCLVAEPTTCGLYWRIPKPDAALASPVDDLRPMLRIGQELLLDTYINCFYERYWRELTIVERISLEIVTSGNCLIRLVRRCDDRSETVRTLTASGAERRTTIHMPSNGAASGVLHVEVRACSEHVIVHEGRWMTIDPRKNDISLAVAICSFGRDDMVADSLNRMAGLVEMFDDVKHVFVVHQGQSDLEQHPAILALRDTDVYRHKLQIIRQANFGGSGGFTRGIIEALRAQASDILLMDDDVRVEPFVLARLFVLLAYLKKPTTIGGQMLDLHDPTILWASHEQVDYAKLSLVNPFKRIDLTKVDVASLFQYRRVSSYNAWWLCSLPAPALERAGLPLPMFIQHDDVEHGVRMTLSGQQVVTMPGLFVWHRGQQTQSKPWLTYYERRNFLINAALHGRVNSLRICILLAAQAWTGLTLYRYEYCWAVCRAAEDYLCGPSLVFSDPRVRHRDIIAESAGYTLQAVKFYRERKDLAHVRFAKKEGFKRTIDLLRSLPLPGPQSRLARKFVWRIFKMGIQLAVFSSRVASDYRTSAKCYSGIAFWTRYLEMPPVPEPRK